MRLTNIEFDPEPEEDLVQFAKHIEENLDPNDEYDCDVQISTIRRSEAGELPGDDIPTRGTDPEVHDVGLHIYIDNFVDNADAPNLKLNELLRSFFDLEEYVAQGRFDGGAGEAEKYVFLVKN